MNRRELAPNSDIERLLKESDTLGADSSLLLRCLRQLIKGGKPLGRIIALTVPIDGEHRQPFGLLTFTRNRRLVFWPVLPRGVRMDCRPSIEVPDHITVEFPSERTHLTAYRENGQPVHADGAWGSVPLKDRRFRLLCMCLIRSEVVVDQDVLIGRTIPIPTRDRTRRTALLAEAVRSIQPLPVPFPGSLSGKHYLYFQFMIAPTDLIAEDLPDSLVPTKVLSKEVDDWAEGSVFPTHVVQLPIQLPSPDEALYLLVALPPGTMHGDVWLGIAQR